MTSPNTEYPKEITFENPDTRGFTLSAQDFVARINAEMKITMLAENIIQIRFPEDIDEIRVVNVDDFFYRIDIRDFCFFPNVPWGRNFMRERWWKGKYTKENGMLTIEYPLQ